MMKSISRIYDELSDISFELIEAIMAGASSDDLNEMYEIEGHIQEAIDALEKVKSLCGEEE